RRLYVHVDRSIRGALSSRRQALVSAARRIDRGAERFVRHALLRSTRFRGRDAVIAPAKERLMMLLGRSTRSAAPTTGPSVGANVMAVEVQQGGALPRVIATRGR